MRSNRTPPGGGNARQWQCLHLFEASYELPPIAIAIDVRDGIVFRLSALHRYTGTFDGLGLGMRVGELLKMPKASWYDGYGQGAVVLEDVPGLFFLQPETDPEEGGIPHCRSARLRSFSRGAV